MIISLNWLRKLTDIDVSVDDLVKLIGSRLVEIEEVIDLKPKYDGILVAKVIDCVKLPDSDHLHITKLDDGGVAQNVERDDDGLVQVVCGAPNISVGQSVAWLPPETIVPETYGKDAIKLDARKLRGVMSYGMIASARELDLFDEHDGILVLDDSIKPGTYFSVAYELDDILLDIENKSLTHRPDCFGIIGFAREVAAIQNKEFKNPDWFNNIDPSFDVNAEHKLQLSAAVDDKNLCDRYQAIIISESNGKKQSPLLIQTYLARVGVRPINALVDVTNYLMLLTGQPLHAFDYDKLVTVGDGKADIHVRGGRQGEKLTLLDGKEIELDPSDTVIASGDTAIGLAGAMGGLNTMIDENTHNIVIESATFNLYNLRGTQMRHGIFSEAITRFTKGQPAGLTAPVLKRASELVGEWADGMVTSEAVDCYTNRAEKIKIEVSKDKINETLGTTFSLSDMARSLTNAGFEVVTDKSELMSINVPWWRQDIHIDEDIIEEIARIYGYDNIEASLPKRDFVAIEPSEFDKFRNLTRKILARSGANEVLTYSFIHGDILKKTNLDISDSYKIINSISPRLQYYRQTLMPSLLGLIHGNIKQGYDEFALFELNKVHHRRLGMNEEGVPVEHNSLALVVTSKSDKGQTQYYLAKHILEYLFRQLNIHLNYHAISENETFPYAAPFELKRSAKIVTDDNVSIGIVGEFKKSVSKSFKLPDETAGFELDNSALFDIFKVSKPKYQPISHYPASERDICFKVPQNMEYASITDAVQKALDNYSINCSMEPLDIFKAKSDDTKNITLRFRFQAYDKTFSKDEVNNIVDRISKYVRNEIGAEVI